LDKQLAKGNSASIPEFIDLGPIEQRLMMVAMLYSLFIALFEG
jgi:hypothetical protein